VAAHEEILQLGVVSLADAIRRGVVSAREATLAYLEQIDRTEPKVHAYLRTLPKQALAQAEAVDAARSKGAELGPLAGVPMALKDIFVTKGIETTSGSKILGGWLPQYQGTHARRLAEAGSVLLGKVTMDEFAMGSSNENTPFEPVRNPWSLEHVAGGSSGGSVAAVAAHSAAFTLGTDTGGSIRQPASLTNCVGFKPTYGRVSRHGMIAFASSLDQAGPITRNVRDAAAVLGVIAGHDPHDATSLREPVPDYLAACDEGVRGKKIGIYREALEHEGLSPAVKRSFEAAMKVYEDAGAELVDIELPHAKYGVAAYYVLSPAEVSSNLARYDGIRYGLREQRDNLLETYEATREAGFGPEVKRRILIGTYVLRASSYEQYYGRAMRVRTLICRDYEEVFKHVDLVAMPTSPVPGFRLGERVDDPLAMYLSDVFTIGANLAGLPAVSIPAGFAKRPRLPVGVQLVGPHLSEPALFAAAAAHEDATEHHEEVAPVAKEGN